MIATMNETSLHERKKKKKKEEDPTAKFIIQEQHNDCIDGINPTKPENSKDEQHEGIKQEISNSKKRRRTEVEQEGDRKRHGTKTTTEIDITGDTKQKKEKKNNKEDHRQKIETTIATLSGNDATTNPSHADTTVGVVSSSTSPSMSSPRPLVESSALRCTILQQKTPLEIRHMEEEQYPISLLLFYQYVTPLWTDTTYKIVQEMIHNIGTALHIHGRIRIAKEGVNCTLSGTRSELIDF
jgi:UPF0176 acylphosphatase like domain